MWRIHDSIRVWAFLQRTSGNAGAEFALILPLLMFLCFGAIELGRALHDYHVVNQTVRNAARLLSRTPADCASVGQGAGVFQDGPVYTAAQQIERARALAMTGNTDTAAPASNLLGYWNYPGDAASTIVIRVDCIDNSAGAFQGLYNGATYVPHVFFQANVPFTFLFGELVMPNATIDFNIAHNVVVTGN
jgi:hypothetical protein